MITKELNLNLFIKGKSSFSFTTGVISLAMMLLGFSSNHSESHEDQRIQKSVTGQINSCDFYELGTSGLQIFIGISFNSIKKPYIRFNVPSKQRVDFEHLCELNAKVTVKYKVKRKLPRTETTYWGLSIKEV